MEVLTVWVGYIHCEQTTHLKNMKYYAIIMIIAMKNPY